MVCLGTYYESRGRCISLSFFVSVTHSLCQSLVVVSVSHTLCQSQFFVSVPHSLYQFLILCISLLSIRGGGVHGCTSLLLTCLFWLFVCNLGSLVHLLLLLVFLLLLTRPPFLPKTHNTHSLQTQAPPFSFETLIQKVMSGNKGSIVRLGTPAPSPFNIRTLIVWEWDVSIETLQSTNPNYYTQYPNLNP